MRNGEEIKKKGGKEEIKMEKCLKKLKIREKGKLRRIIRKNMKKMIFGDGFKRRDNRKGMNKIDKINYIS